MTSVHSSAGSILTKAGWQYASLQYPPNVVDVLSGVFKPTAPVLILIGDMDDWTPVEPCRKLAAVAQAAGYPVELTVYPGAHHSFDSEAPVIYRPERININSPSGRGATTGGSAEAWADAIGRVHAFLSQTLAR